MLPKFFIFLSSIFFVLTVSVVKAQLIDSGEILRAGAYDANILLKEYLRPFGGGFGADLNSGWFTSAKPLDEYNFTFHVSVSASVVPAGDRMFDVTQLNLRTVRLMEGPPETPTVFGDNKNIEASVLGNSYLKTAYQQDNEPFSFKMPEGIGINYVPAPMAQFSLGLPYHTQLTVRFTPTISIENEYKIRIFGAGGMVGINPLIFGNKLPVDLSLQAGFMNLNANAEFEVRPDEDKDARNPYPDTQWDGQGVEMYTHTFTSNLLIGKSFSVLSIFTGIGYQFATTDIKTIGSYPILVPNEQRESPANPSQEFMSLDEPINFSLDGANTVHFSGGFRIKISFISLSASYTLAEYSTLRAGFGIVISP